MFSLTYISNLSYFWSSQVMQRNITREVNLSRQIEQLPKQHSANMIQIIRFPSITNIKTPKVEWFESFDCSPVERVKAEGWYILGEHFLSALSSRVRGQYSLPKTEEYHDRYCHSYSRNNDKVGVLNFPHFGPRQLILLEKKPKCFPGIFQQAFPLICL